MVCDRCGVELHIGDFPFCKGTGSHGRYTGVVVADDIPGGVLVNNGICNSDGSPRRYYTKSSMAAEAKRRGLVNNVHHVTAPGTDKNRHTQRFV